MTVETKAWGKWQPIETAPKDGTIILARQGGYYPCYIRWMDGNWQSVSYHATHVPTHWLPPESRDGENGDE